MTKPKKSWAWCAIFLSVVLGESRLASAVDLREISKQARLSTVFFHYEATDNTTGAPIPVSGSGLIVSPAGDILTAYHVLKPWFAQTSAEKGKDPNKLWVRIGSIHAESLEVLLVDAHTDEPSGGGGDVAILKIRRPGDYKAAAACYSKGKQMGDRIIAFGFPGATEFNYAEGAIAHEDGPGSRWTANINVAKGMSGGPVYDAQHGNVIGFVKGGLTDVSPVRYITQLARAKHLLEARGVQLQICGTGTTVGSPAPVGRSPPVAIGCREIGFIDYSQMPPRQSKRVVCD